jgi:uncharacterized protein (DUF305 family)
VMVETSTSAGDTRPTSDGGPAPRREARWVRPLVVVGAVVSLLLLGAAGGLLIGLPGSSEPAVPRPSPVDIGFAQDMSVHHLQAVEMASWERDHTTDPELAQLAADIEATQTGQIGRMQGWLSLWGAPALPTGGHMTWMSGSGHGHSDAATDGVNTMPGMASPEELEALRSATGKEMDILFLQLMLRHHQGGVAMAEYAAEHAAVPQVRNLASQILASQAAESEYMRQLLAERGAEPLPL